MLCINNEENKLLLRLKRDNLQVLMTCQHDKDVEEINLLQTEIEMETAQKLKEIHAAKRASTETIAAENIRTLAEARAQAFETKVIKEAEAYKAKQEILADVQAKIILENAESRLAVAKDKSQALIREASAEEKAAGPMEGMRRHEEKMKLAGSMQ